MWTTKELAKEAGVDPSALRHLLLSGKLEGFKLGRDWLIPQEEGERYIEQRRTRGRYRPPSQDQPEP